MANGGARCDSLSEWQTIISPQRLLYLHKSQVLLLLIKRNDQTCFLDEKEISLGIESKSEWIYSERLPIGHWLMPSEVLLFFNACMQTAGYAAGRDAGCQKNLW